MQPRALVSFAVALVLAGISVALARAWLTSIQDRQPSAAQSRPAAGPEAIQIVVAARPLRYGDKLGPADIKLAAWPKSTVPTGALHRLEPLSGKAGDPAPVVMRPIEVNEPVLTSKITGFGAPARLAATIASGMRATTISMTGAPDMAALIGPGDRVDVLMARTVSSGGQDRVLLSDILLRDIRVLGLDQDAGGPASSKRPARSVTLEVSVEQAQKLALAQKVGTLSLALRGVKGRDGEVGAGRQISSRDLPAGLVSEASWDREEPPTPNLAQLLSDPVLDLSGSAVRVFRGLEESQYTVTPEGSRGTMRAIDAAKSRAAGGASERPK
jgi:pilus assembly protein CpaB